MDTTGRTPSAPGRQGAGADGAAEGLRSPAADGQGPQPVRPLGNAPRTDGGDSERPSKAVSLTPGLETLRVAHWDVATASGTDSEEMQPGTETPDSLEEETCAWPSPTHPLYCLY